MNLQLKREEIPLGIAGIGKLNFSVDVPRNNVPLPPDKAKLIDLKFDVNGSTPLKFGKPGNAVLAIEAHTSAKLEAIFPPADAVDQKLLEEFGLTSYFAQNPSDLLMTLRLGASAGAAINAPLNFNALSVQGSVSTGADGGYTLIRPYRQNALLGEMIPDFLRSIKMPANVQAPLAPGELIAFEYGGYLRLGASVSLGYQIQGAPSFQIGDLKLSEKYSFGLLGTVGLQTATAGRFRIEVRGADAPADSPGRWVRVTVRKSKSNSAGIAADVRLRATSSLSGLPQSSDEFLGALLGVNARSWLKYIQTVEARVKTLSDVDELQKMADSLARQFLGKLVGKAFDEFGPQLDVVLPRLRAIVEAYEKAGDRAVALFDRYFDRIDTVLKSALQQIGAAQSWTAVLNRINDPEIARVVETLAGGDPLQAANGFLGTADNVLKALREAASGVLGQIQNRAHEEILDVVKLVKEQFGLDPLFAEIARIDTKEELRARANDFAGGFVERLIGKAVGELQGPEIEKVLRRVRQVAGARVTFQEKLFDKFREMAEQSFQLSLHVEYSRSTDRDALLDVLLNLDEEKGRQLLPMAAEGDFSAIVEAYRPPEHPSDPDPAAAFRPNAVRILEGALSHRTRRESAFKVNVIGWHRNWIYQGFDRVIVDTDQQIQADASGALTVYTTFELKKEKLRKTGLTAEQEEIYTNFVLRFLGESKGALEFDKDNQQFLVDAIQSMSARYDLNFKDEKTTAEELRYYLSFAQAFGLGGAGATFENLAPMLPSSNRNFGRVEAAYQVIFAEDGLRNLFTSVLDAGAARSIMRAIVYANYVREDEPFLTDIARVYATPAVHDMFVERGPNFENASALNFRPISDPLIAAPIQRREDVTLRNPQLRVLATLYRIEDSFVAALGSLQQILAAGQVKPAQFEDALQDFGSALKQFDNFDRGVNTVFAVFDHLIRASGGDALGDSMLRLKSEAGGRNVEKIVMRVAPRAAGAGGAH